MPKAKPYSGPVDDKLAAQLLNSTGATAGDRLLGDALIEARRQVEHLVERANDVLETSDFAKIVAEHLAAKMNRRGNAEIGVADTGHIKLYISYDDQSARRPAPPKAKLPLLEDLKARAGKMGVDISEFGIKRKKILEHLDGIESGEIKPPKAKPRRKKAPPVQKVQTAQEPPPVQKAPPVQKVQTAQEPPEEDPGPMSAGPDETRVSAPPDDPKPPKKRNIVKKADEAAGPVVVGTAAASEKSSNSVKSQGARGSGPNMRDLVQESKEVSIADLLHSEPPKQ